MSVKIKKLREEEFEREEVGLVDGSHIVLDCSNCRAALMEIWVTQPDAIDPRTGEPFKWKVRASCPFCNDHSFIKEVSGVFHQAGYGEGGYGEEGEDEPVVSTRVESFDVVGDTFVFKIRKDSPDAKPIKR